MCVIFAKAKGITLPKMENMVKMADHNPDGMGYMVAYDNKVHIHKGFDTVRDMVENFYNEIYAKNLDETDVGAVFHFRISTQGGTKKGLCHPYPICDSYDKMRKLHSVSSMGLAHNGIISNCCSYSSNQYVNGKWVKSEPNYNDSMTFIKEYASLIIDNDYHFTKDTRKLKLIKNIIGKNNKLAILNGNGYISLIGDFIHDDKDGCYYSNKLFENTYYGDYRRYGGATSAIDDEPEELNSDMPTTAINYLSGNFASGYDDYEDNYALDDRSTYSYDEILGLSGDATK